jgi:hypothetical protein
VKWLSSKIKLIALVIIGVLATVGVVYAVTNFALTIPTGGSITTGASLTSNPASIDWGTNLQPGATVTRSFNVTNTRTQENTGPLNLTITTNTVGKVRWNAENNQILPGATVNVTVYLDVYTNATAGPFAFPLYLKG